MTQQRKVPRWVWVVVKAAVAAVVVAWMLRTDVIRLDPGDLDAVRAHWPLLAVAFVIIIVDIFLTSVRWGILLRAQDIHFHWLDLFRFTMAGFFFTVVAPGGLGGDAVKAVYIARSCEKKAEAAATIFVDRVIGLATLALVACVMVAIDFEHLWNAPVKGLDRFGMPGGRVLVLGVAASMAGTVALAVLATSKRVRRSRWLARLSRFVPFRRVVLRVYDAVHLYGDRRRALLQAVLVSVVAQVPLYAVYYLYGLALGVDIRVWQCALIVPPATAVRVLPIMPGGLGQGMAAMGVLFGLVGVQRGADIGALGDAMFILTYLAGGLVFVFGRGRGREVRAPAAADADAGPGAP